MKETEQGGLVVCLFSFFLLVMCISVCVSVRWYLRRAFAFFFFMSPLEILLM